MPLRRHGAHEQEKDEEIGNREAVGERKKFSAGHARYDGGKKRIRDQHADERGRVHPWQILHAAARTDLLANRPENVVPSQDDEVKNEREPHGPHFIGVHIHCAVAQIREERAHCYRGACGIRSTDR